MKNTNEGGFISEAEAKEVRYMIWGRDEIGAVEEIAMIYSACRGALEDIRAHGRWSVTKIDFLNDLERLRIQALQGLYAAEADEYLDAVLEGSLFD